MKKRALAGEYRAAERGKSWNFALIKAIKKAPEGKSCRDHSLHDQTYLKENLEKLFAYRAEHGFAPLTPEPPEGWL